MKREYIVITGAAGFIGSNLAHRLSASDADLLLVDHPLSGNKTHNLLGLRAFEYIDHDKFLERLRRSEFERSPSVIFHLGACSSTTETDVEYLRRNNIEYSRHLWTWAAENGCPFIYASSAATYGDGSAGFDDTTSPDRLLPLNPYGRSKNEFDRWALAQEVSGKAPRLWAGMKFFNVYGPRENHKGSMASVVFKAFHQIRERGYVSLFASNAPHIRDGEQRRDFVFVEDCIDHMLWLWQHSHDNGLYNSGTGNARTFIDLVKAVFAALHRPADIRFIEMPEQVRAQYQNFTEAKMDKLRNSGCDFAFTPLEEGVAAYISAFMNI